MSRRVNHYIIVKYKPWLYLPNWGAYQSDEFTNVFDIGYERNGKIVTVSDYLYWENNYVAFIMELLERLNISWLRATKLSYGYCMVRKNNRPEAVESLIDRENDIDRKLVDPRFRKILLSLEEKCIISYNLIPDLLRSYFRELAWSYLMNLHRRFFLDIHEDSYIHIDAPMQEMEMMKLAAKYGLYVNPRFYIDGYPINVDDYRIV